MAARGSPAGVREGGLQCLCIGECLSRLHTVWFQLLRVPSPLPHSTPTGSTDLCPLGGLATPGARPGTLRCPLLFLSISPHAPGLRSTYLPTVTTTRTVCLVLSGDLGRTAACSRAVLLARCSTPLTGFLCPRCSRGHMTLVRHAHCNLQQHQRAGRASIKSTYM